jgi:orotate phosphoribosyltransferase-like protein
VILDRSDMPIYMRIAQKAEHLRELGMSDKAIARALGVSDKTVAKATAFQSRTLWARGHSCR